MEVKWELEMEVKWKLEIEVEWELEKETGDRNVKSNLLARFACCWLLFQAFQSSCRLQFLITCFASLALLPGHSPPQIFLY